jgi:hypothetical protein
MLTLERMRDSPFLFHATTDESQTTGAEVVFMYVFLCRPAQLATLVDNVPIVDKEVNATSA